MPEICTPTLRLTYLLLALAALTGFVGCGRHAPAAPSQDQPQVPESAPRVVAGLPTKRTLRLVTSQPARIEAMEETPVVARVPGYVEQVLVDIGDRVSKDQILAKIAVPELRDDRDQKQALVVQADAELKQANVAVIGAKAAAQTAQTRVALAEAGVVRAKGSFERWTSKYDRIKKLAATDAVDALLVDETLNELRAAEGANGESLATVESARAALHEATIEVQRAETAVAVTDARLRVARAALARVDTMLAYASVKSPYAGVVVQRRIATGHYVGPDDPATTSALFVVCRSDTMRVFVEVPELLADYVDVGDMATIHVQALPNRTFQSRVVRTTWSLDPVNRSLRAEIDLPNENGALRPGMFAAATIVLEERPDATTLPAAAVARDGADHYCWTVDDASQLARQKIKLGLRVENDVEVSGLEPGRAVVLSSIDGLKEGQIVNAVAAEIR
ncbi:MAG TPA: efflux RND transporter periplasmic adaptor subunit [Pirellulales bacterium]|jgi:RND family efflux transporter MFP subunit|nr:efflux RND transporter periplasmic adaptor subunit [Pirellulales bacterium]